MNENETIIHIKGTAVSVASREICGRTIIVTGNWLRQAIVKDEELIEGVVAPDPDTLVEQLRADTVKADVFTFPEDFRNRREERFNYYWEYDNLAVLSLTTYGEWEKGLSQDTRRNIRKAGKAGLVVKTVQLDDELLRGIKTLYDETPVRQGRRFWHYGKDLQTLHDLTATFPARSEFIAAHHADKLVGFIKLIYTDDKASVIHLVSSNGHYDKRPANAMVAKAVEVCIQKGMHHLIYRKYIYGKNTGSSLTEFKRRNGFHEVRFPRYYAALTLRGKLALKLRMHHSYKEYLPEPLAKRMLAFRAWMLERFLSDKRRSNGKESRAVGLG